MQLHHSMNMAGRGRHCPVYVRVALVLVLVQSVYCCLSDAEIRSHPRVSLASLLDEEPSVAKAKRGGAWGFPSKTVGPELRAMPVDWWYNWGNYIPDVDAANITKVIPKCYLKLHLHFCIQSQDICNCKS